MWTLQRAGRLEPSRGLPARAESKPSKTLREEPPDTGVQTDVTHSQPAEPLASQ